MKKVYLSGPMENVKDFGTSWRKSTEKKLKQLGYKVFNPCNTKKLTKELKELRVNTEHGFDLQKVRKQFADIVKIDLDAVFTSNIVLVKWDNDVMSYGTGGEITVAKAFNIPIIMVVEKEQIKKISKWLLGCVSIFVETLEDGILEIQKLTSNHYFDRKRNEIYYEGLNKNGGTNEKKKSR